MRFKETPTVGVNSPTLEKLVSPGAFLSISYFMAPTSLLVQFTKILHPLIVEVDVANSVSNFPKAAFRSGMPYPILSFGVAAILPASRNALTILILLTSGNACQRIVDKPAILGQAKEVPLPVVTVLLGD